MRSLYSSIRDRADRKSELQELFEERRKKDEEYCEQIISASREFFDLDRSLEERQDDIVEIMRTAEKYMNELVQVEESLKERGRRMRYDPKEFFGRTGGLDEVLGELGLHEDRVSSATRRMHDFVLGGGECFVKNEHLWGHPDMARLRRRAVLDAVNPALFGAALAGGTAVAADALGGWGAAGGLAVGVGIAAFGARMQYHNRIYGECVYKPFSELAGTMSARLHSMKFMLQDL